MTKVSKLKVSDYSSSNYLIKQGTPLGCVSRVEGALKADVFVNTLNHKPAEQLSKSEIQERHDYLVNKLRINKNKLLNKNFEMKEDFIALFLKYFDT